MILITGKSSPALLYLCPHSGEHFEPGRVLNSGEPWFSAGQVLGGQFRESPDTGENKADQNQDDPSIAADSEKNIERLIPLPRGVSSPLHSIPALFRICVHPPVGGGRPAGYGLYAGA